MNENEFDTYDEEIKCPYDEFLKRFQWMGRVEKQQALNPYPGKKLYIFAEDKEGETGSATKAGKVFFTGAVPAWTKFVFSLQPEKRFGNCIITEEEPLHCFMDLEFNKQLNPEHNIELAIPALIHYFGLALKKLAPKITTPMLHDFIILSASNHKKESIHIHGPFTIAFKNVYHLKLLMKTTERLIMQDVGNPLANSCIIRYQIAPLENPEKIYSGTLIDMSIYSHHHGCRQYLCTKAGEFRPFVLSSLNQFKFPAELSGQELDKFIFERTISNHVVQAAELLVLGNDKEIECMMPLNARKRASAKKDTHKTSAIFLVRLGKVDPSEATHFEWIKDFTEKAYRKVINLQELQESMAQCMVPKAKHFFTTCERITAVTRLAFELTIPATDLVPWVVSQIRTALGKQVTLTTRCIVLNCGENTYRLLFPHVTVEKAHPKLWETVNLQVKKTLGEQNVQICENFYTREFVTVLGAKQPNHNTVQFAGCFDDNGDPVEMAVQQQIHQSSMHLRE